MVNICRIAVLSMVLVVAYPLSAFTADGPTDDQPEPFQDHRADPSSSSSGVDELKRLGIEVVNPDDLEPEELRSLLKGAEALPPAAWDAIRKPLEIEYIDEPCLFSMGRYNERCPTFEDDDQRRFYVYEATPLIGEGGVEQLEILTAEEQRDLQLRRAVVHLAMVHLDELFGWSQQQQWRAINGWPRGDGEALNRDPWGYSRYLGMQSSRLDLVTFGEEFFVRPEDLLAERAEDDDSANQRLADVDPDQTVTCRQFTKRRMFNDKLSQLDQNWEEPTRRLPKAVAQSEQCPAFERWARVDDLEGFELLLAAATSDQPESLFGHLLLHVRYNEDDEDGVGARGFEPVYQFGAITDTDVDIVEYYTRGFLGGFPSILELNTFRGIDQLFLGYQQRDLRRYRLQLTDQQQRQLLERIWEAERQIRYPYLFLTDNCASFLLDLLAPAVEVPIPNQRGPVVMPTDVLDTLAQLENGTEGSLLQKVAPTRRSNRNVAEQAVVQRRALVRKLADQLEDRPADAEELQEILDRLDDTDPERRYDGYEQARTLFSLLLADKPDVADTVVDIMYHSVAIERYFRQMAHFARHSVYAQTHEEVDPVTIDEVLEQRRQIYRHDDMEARLKQFEELTVESERALADGPRRELTEREKQVVEYDEKTHHSYTAALQVHSHLVERYNPEWSGVQILDDNSEAWREEKERVKKLSQPASGRNTLSLGGHVRPTERVGVVDFSYSLMHDRLGEVRHRGYRGDVGARLLGVDASVPIAVDAGTRMRFDLVVASYQSLRGTYGPLRQGFFDLFGWGIDGRIVHDGRRNLWAAAELTPSVLLPLVTGDQSVNHLVAHTGVGLRYDVVDTQYPMAGLTGGLFGQLHLYGDYANVLRFGAETGHYAGLTPEWRFDVDATVQTRHLVATVGDRPVTLVPFGRLLWTTRDYRDDAPESGFRSWEAGMQVDLSF